ncbi:cardiolipin synthase [Thiorhodococcus fuscus]|uniref:Cardiolipin synthase n=1 Tax=Thiorhodococcus fuscus TaxID=527200 RepID=A0ABW4Y913_9GAMM
MTGLELLTGLLVAAHLLLQIAVAIRVILRPHRDPASRMAWLVVIFSLPVLGLIAYLLLGETNIGRRRAERRQRLVSRLQKVVAAAPTAAMESDCQVPERHAHLFQTGRSITGFTPVCGNTGALMPGSDATVDAMIADIDAATDHVHLLFYIWLPDRNGCRVAEALRRAAARGVVCRAIADDLGSRLMIGSKHWKTMAASGVRLARALPIGSPLRRVLSGRIDLRNHRKIVVIDGRITYCGSQNCADPEFFVKAKYGPWVDAVIRFEGPIARQNQGLFATDWMAHVDEDLGDLLRQPWPDGVAGGFPAQVIGTGPTVRYSAMPELFEALTYAARHELVITTPYYVPDEAMQAALCASARRGVDTTIVFPARNDSWIVSAASRSYYADLLDAGVHIFEYVGGLLHTKSLTLDGEITLIGSANMDRRSFELNYENNILLHDPELTAAVRDRQAQYIASANAVSPDQVAGWNWRRRLWNNAVAILGPVL